MHQGRWYAFGGLITLLCRQAGVPEEPYDYHLEVHMDHFDVTNAKVPEPEQGPIYTITERCQRDKLITVRMFEMQLHVYTTGSQPPTP